MTLIRSLLPRGALLALLLIPLLGCEDQETEGDQLSDAGAPEATSTVLAAGDYYTPKVFNVAWPPPFLGSPVQCEATAALDSDAELLVLDISVSMDGDNINMVRPAALQFLDQIQAEDPNRPIGLIVFGSEAEEVIPLCPGNLARVREYVESVDPKDRTTAMHAGLRLTMDVIIRTAHQYAGNLNVRILGDGDARDAYDWQIIEIMDLIAQTYATVTAVGVNYHLDVFDRTGVFYAKATTMEELSNALGKSGSVETSVTGSGDLTLVPQGFGV